MNNRKIVLDTETTGLNMLSGDRIIEIAAVEILNDEVLGEEFHYFVNPERDIPEDSSRIHGITNEHVKDKPIFSTIAKNFKEFIGDSLIIAHNSEFDRSFINVELDLAKHEVLPKERFIDSLLMARELFPGEKVSLDNLCNRFSIDLSSRENRHGALIDAKLLAEVYIRLCKLNPNILFSNHNTSIINNNKFKPKNFKYREFKLTTEELEEHNKFLSKIKNNLWNNSNTV